MRFTVGFLLALTALVCSAHAADYPPNERPMYGGITKTAAMIAADEAIIKAAEKLGTRPQVSDITVETGWAYFFKNDVATAIKRFNQAWLLDPDNGNAFHGFALVVFARDHDAAFADQLFQQGLAKRRQSPGIYLDYGRFLLTVNRASDAAAQLQKALTFPDMGPDATALLTLALAEAGDMAGACAAAAKVQDGAQASIRDEARALLQNKECQPAQ